MVRVHPGHQRKEVIVRDITRQPQHGRGVTDPATTWLTRLQVLVRRPVDVVCAGTTAVEGRDANRHHTSPLTGVSVHSSVLGVLSVRRARGALMPTTPAGGATSARADAAERDVTDGVSSMDGGRVVRLNRPSGCAGSVAT